MEEIVKKRLNIEKDISSELEDIKKIIQSSTSDTAKIKSIEKILSKMADEIVDVKTESIFENRTGFLSAKFGDDFLEKEIEVCRRYNRGFSIALLDIDHLKYINDNFGHVAGTKAILTVADSIKKYLRKSDVVSRYGGDEFLIIFVNTGLKQAKKAINRINKQIAKRNSRSKVKVTISCGLAEIESDKQTTALEILEVADKNLYEAKKLRVNLNAPIST